MCSSSWRNCASIACGQNSMVYLNMKSTSLSRESMIRMRGSSPADIAFTFLIVRSYETITDLMGLQEQIESFQKMTFATFRHSVNNECRISSLVPLVKESWGIYRFITSMMRAMYRSMPPSLACPTLVLSHLQELPIPRFSSL